jgi:clan AA aspartic protease
MAAMGLFRVLARLTGPTGRTETVEALVDTGATFLVVPRALAERLELSPTRTCPIETAGGRIDAWPLAEVRLRLDGHEVTTPCLIAAEGSVLLGTVALESLLLAADPVARRLVPVRGFVGASPRLPLPAPALVG